MSTEPNTSPSPPLRSSQNPDPSVPSPPPNPRSPSVRGSRSAPLLVSVGVAIGLFLGIGGTLLAGGLDLAGSPFEGALRDCGLQYRKNAVIGDEGGSLDLDTRGEKDPTGLTVDELYCVLDQIETPDGVISHMKRTRALDGRQSAEWKGMEASWSYHPDTGLDVLLIRR